MDHPLFHRVAVANIATPCRYVGRKETFVLAIQNDSARKAGRIEFGAIGGGALITEEGCSELRTIAPTDFEFHDDDVQLDARMTFLAKSERDLSRRRTMILQTILGWAKAGDAKKIELDVTREFIEELVEDAPGILTLQQVTSINTRLVGWKCGSLRQSNRGAGGMMTTPLYFCHSVVFEDERVLDTLLNDTFGRVRIISDEEMATTDGGQHEGRTRDGHVLFSNVFSPECIRPL